MHLLNGYFDGDSMYQLALGVDKKEIKVYWSGGITSEIKYPETKELMEKSKNMYSLQYLMLEKKY